MAYITGVLLATMSILFVSKLISGSEPVWYGTGWMLHGWAYILYVAAALDMAFRLRWALLPALLVVLAGTVPFMSFVAERKVTHAVQRRIAQDASANLDATSTPA
jgi:integral membrane protein